MDAQPFDHLAIGDPVLGEAEAGGQVVGTLTELDDETGTIAEAGGPQSWRLPRQSIHRI
jgi:hypothetical protein